MKIEVVVISAPENIMERSPDFLTSATKGAVVTLANTVLMELNPLITFCYVSVISGAFNRNQFN